MNQALNLARIRYDQEGPKASPHIVLKPFAPL